MTASVGACFAISSDPNEELLLSTTVDSEELNLGNEAQAAVELPPHSVVLEKLLEVITHAIANLA